MTTLKDLAKYLNMSPSTVSKALSAHPDVSEKTKKLVAEAAQTLNYIPNRNAQSLAKQTSNMIGFMVQDISDGFFAASAYGAEEVLVQNGYELMYYSAKRDPQRVLQFLKVARQHAYCGIFITPNEWSQQLLQEVGQLNIPVISLRRKSPVTAQRIPFVDSNHYGGARNAVERLVQLGHEHIGIITSDHLNDAEKVSGYKYAIERNQCAEHIQFINKKEKGDAFESGYHAMQQLLSQQQGITAAIVTEEKSAIGSYHYLQSQGIRIPEDFSLISFDNRGISSLYCFQLATVQQDLLELGVQAANMMLRMIKDPTVMPASITLETQLCERNSIAPVPQST